MQLRASLVQRALAPVLAGELEEIEGEEDDGRFGHDLHGSKLDASPGRRGGANSLANRYDLDRPSYLTEIAR